MRFWTKAALVASGVLGTALATLPNTATAGARKHVPSGMTIQIDGPQNVQGYSNCTWTGANGPYRYWWYSSQLDQGTEQAFTTRAPGKGPVELGLSVETAEGTEFVSRVVYASPAGVACP
jgi:hypothetical protein